MKRIAAACIACSLSGCSIAPKSPECQRVDHPTWGPPGRVQIDVETVVSGLEVPWGIGFLPDGAMLVTERPGRIRLWRGGALTTVGEVAVAPDGEGGLLGIAIAPDFADSRAFFIYYTAQEDGGTVNRVERWRLSEDGASARFDARLLDDIPAAQYHDGGRLRIGPDGKLYVGTGDAREPGLSQQHASPAGKILRLELDGAIPADNPFSGPTFIYGLRNTQGFDWIDDDTLVVTDHGPSGELAGRRHHDEVTVARAGDNLGWPEIYACEAAEGMRSPAMTWATAAPPGGAAIYRGHAIPEWTGSLLMGVLGAKHLHRLVIEGERVASHEVYLLGDPPGGAGRLRDVIMGPDGDLYVTTSNCDGRGTCPSDGDRILRITRR